MQRGDRVGPSQPQSPSDPTGEPYLQHEGPHEVEGDQAQQQQLEAGVGDVPQCQRPLQEAGDQEEAHQDGAQECQGHQEGHWG